MAINEVRVGPFTAADGAQITARGSRDSSTVVMDGHARYQEAVFRGGVYIASMQAGAAMPVGLSTAVTTALSLYNPIASGKNLVIWDVSVGMTVALGAAAAGVVGLSAGVGPNVAAPTTVTALTPVNALLNGATNNVAKVYSLATYGAAPVYIKTLLQYQTGTATGAADAIAPSVFDLGGSVIVPPGAFIAFSATTAITAQEAITWEEISV